MIYSVPSWANEKSEKCESEWTRTREISSYKSKNPKARSSTGAMTDSVPSWANEESEMCKSEWTRTRDETTSHPRLSMKNLRVIEEDDGTDFGDDPDGESTDESIDESTDESIDESTDESIDESTDESDEASIDESDDASFDEATIVDSLVLAKLRKKRLERERPFQLDEMEPNWSSLTKYNGKFMSYDFPASIKDVVDDVPLTRRHPKSARVKMSPHPFARGAERVAFYGLDLSTFIDEKKSGGRVEKRKMEQIVLKEYLHEEMNSAKRYELSNQMQTVADYLAREFSKELQERCRHPTATLKFLKIKTLLITSSTGENRLMSCERRFSRADEFVRFSNNACYQLTEKKAMEKGVPIELLQQIMAISHWTYKVTLGFLMVVDLEGIVSKELGTNQRIIHLTDPAIHCKDHTRYGRMNHGTVGMKEFFAYHKCNRFCSILGLKATRPKDNYSD